MALGNVLFFIQNLFFSNFHKLTEDEKLLIKFSSFSRSLYQLENII